MIYYIYMKLRGFTLTEMMVVTGIIGLLVGIAIYGVREIKTRSRDETAIADIEQIAQLVEQYKSVCRTYPLSLNKNNTEWNRGINFTSCNSGIVMPITVANGVEYTTTSQYKTKFLYTPLALTNQIKFVGPLQPVRCTSYMITTVLTDNKSSPLQRQKKRLIETDFSKYRNCLDNTAVAAPDPNGSTYYTQLPSAL